MIPGMPGNQITPEQAPPLGVPFLFFFVGMVHLPIAAFVALAFRETLLVSNWVPEMLGFTHFATLGFLASIMMGALYQMIPVVAGRPVPMVRSGYLVMILHVLGTGHLIAGLSRWNSTLMALGICIELGAMVVFILPVLYALFRAPTQHASVNGMRMAVLALLVTVGLGVVLGLAHLGIPYSGTRPNWLKAHMTFGVLGWVGMLIMSVSWQVIPMFYLTPAYSARNMKWMNRWAGLFLLIVPFGLWFHAIGVSSFLIEFGALAMATIIWLVHPLVTLNLIRRKRRKVRDGSLWFWTMGLMSGLACLPLVIVAFNSDSTYWPLVTGWVVLWGWAGSIVHGMLYRIIPFLAWFQWFSGYVGTYRVPSMKSILPETFIMIGFLAHMVTLILGIAVIGFKMNALFEAFCAGLGLTGFIILLNFFRTIFESRKAVASLGLGR